MKQAWLYMQRDDVATERLQCEQEGRDLTSVAGEIERILTQDFDDPATRQAAGELLDRTIALPYREDCALNEPSDLEGIRAARPAMAPALSKTQLSPAELEDRVHGAWAGRCAGCLLGKPVEGWHRDRMWTYLKELERWPLADYFRISGVPAELRERLSLDPGHCAWADRVTFMPEDDDTNYTTTALACMKQYGPGFTPENVAEFWMNNIPILHTCTAERIAYRNVVNGIDPPDSATYRNPYREWIGAQIRADFWGYVAPGNPELAAEFAWRDASISHVKNGIYGEMWAAAMMAAAFVAHDVLEVLEAGLAQIPERCRLAESVQQVMSWHKDGADYDTAVERIHTAWDERRAHDWCHTISNAMIVTAGLLWGGGDYGQSICRAVQPCFDTDCNGATVGSIMGILLGRNALPAQWLNPIQDTLQTGVAGYQMVTLKSITRDSLAEIEKVDNYR